MKTDAPLFSLGSKDLIKGFILAVITIVLTGLVTALNSGNLPDLATLKTLGITGLAAGLSYLLKNFFTNSKDSFATSEPEKASPFN